MPILEKCNKCGIAEMQAAEEAPASLIVKDVLKQSAGLHM